MARKVAGSVGVTPKRRSLSVRDNIHDAEIPNAMPIPARRRVWSTMRVCRPAAEAPRAMRMPSSWVRRATE